MYSNCQTLLVSYATATSASVPVHSNALLPLLTGGPTFFVAILATCIVQNYKKNIQKAHFQAGHIFIFFLGPS
jgi:hypothetical protein